MFDEQYELWLAEQSKTRKGEALRKLNEDHGYSEKLFVQELWWPLFGNFDYLHGEYEVPHSRNSSYYLDYAFIRPPYLIDWEVDDFSSHAKNITRRGFDYEKTRQNQLIHDGWLVYRFSLDAIKERPLQCQQFIQQVMGKLYGGIHPDAPALSLKQRAILRLALRLQRPFTPLEVCIQLGVQAQHARKLLHELTAMELLTAESGCIRVRKYSLGRKAPTWI